MTSDIYKVTVTYPVVLYCKRIKCKSLSSQVLNKYDLYIIKPSLITVIAKVNLFLFPDGLLTIQAVPFGKFPALCLTLESGVSTICGVVHVVPLSKLHKYQFFKSALLSIKIITIALSFFL